MSPMSRWKWKNLALLSPTLSWYFFFLVIPLGIILFFSFLHKGDYGQIEYTLDIQNYARVFESIYLQMVVRSLFLASLTTITCLFLGFPMAYFMARARKPYKQILFALLIIPFWSSFIVRIYALKLMIGDSGFLNQMLLALGWISAPLILTNNWTGIMIGMIYNYLPFMVLALFIVLDKLDYALLDAAYDLGANRLQTLSRILLPLAMPGIFTGFLFVFIPAFGEFVIPDLLGGSQQMYVGNLINETFLKNHDWPFGSALSTILILLSLFGFVWTAKKQRPIKDITL